MPQPPKPLFGPDTYLGRLIGRTKQALMTAGLAVGCFASGILLLGFVTVPPAFIMQVTTRYVDSVPAAKHLFWPAFGGLFLGVYVLPFSIFAGSFSRRMSARIAKLSPVTFADAEPGKFVAVTAHVASGRPVESLQSENQPEEERVGYPIILRDAAGDSVIVDHFDGSVTPPGPMWHGYGSFRVGDPVIAVGEVMRGEATTSIYRTSAETARFVRGKSPYFRVEKGDLSGLVEQISYTETSRVWGLVGIGLLLIGGLSVYIGSTHKTEWLMTGYLRSRAHAANGFAQHRVIGGNDSNVCQ